MGYGYNTYNIVGSVLFKLHIVYECFQYFKINSHPVQVSKNAVSENSISINNIFCACIHFAFRVPQTGKRLQRGKFPKERLNYQLLMFKSARKSRGKIIPNQRLLQYSAYSLLRHYPKNSFKLVELENNLINCSSIRENFRQLSATINFTTSNSFPSRTT